MKIFSPATQFILLVSMSFLATTFTHAEEKGKVDLTEISLEELVNVKVEAATKTHITQMEVPQAITVLNRSDIERISVTNLGELLRSVVGANVVRAHTSQNVLATRGSNAFTPSKILILIDGQAIDPTLFSTTWWELVPVSINDIERIEFIRSPGTIYGANAQHGVINIVTQKIGLEESNNHKVKFVGRLGQQHLQGGYLSYLGKVSNVSYRLSSELTKVSAYENEARREIIPGRLSAAGEQTFSDKKNDLNLQNFSGALQAKVHGNVLDVNLGFKNIENVQGRVPDRLCFVGIAGLVGYSNVKYSFGSMGAHHAVSVGTDLVNYKFLRNDDAKSLTPAEMTQSKINFGYEFQKTMWENHNLLFGGSYSLETAKNVSGVRFFTNERVNKEPIVTADVQDEWRITENDRVYIGGLFSNHYVVGSNFSPMLAYVHKFNDRNVLRLASFTSYRNPNTFEHSMDYDQATGASTKRTHLVPNRSLRAERTTSYEIGFRSQARENLFFSIDAYVNQVKNGIEWTLVGVDTVPSPRPQYRSENSLSQRIGGLEAVLKYKFSKHWSAEGDVYATTLANKSSRPEYRGSGGQGPNNIGEGRYGAKYVPPYIYNVILNFDRSRVHTNLRYQHTAAHTWQWPSWNSITRKDEFPLKPVPSYGVLNAYVRVDILKSLGVAIEAYNLLDNRHTEWRGDESYFGRAIWATAYVNIK